MFTGTNPSGKKFDVINEEREVIGSFDEIGEASACGKSAPWWHGVCDIRQDRARRDSGRLPRGEWIRQAEFYAQYPDFN